MYLLYTELFLWAMGDFPWDFCGQFQFRQSGRKLNMYLLYTKVMVCGSYMHSWVLLNINTQWETSKPSGGG